VIRLPALERPRGDWDETAGETAVQSNRQDSVRHMRHAARTNVGKAGKPYRSYGIEVAYDQIDQGVSGYDVAKLPSSASLAVIEVNVRNLDPPEFEDERYPLASRSQSRWTQIPLQPWRQVQSSEMLEAMGTPGGQPIRSVRHEMADITSTSLF
jgi:hypothetical protein